MWQTRWFGFSKLLGMTHQPSFSQVEFAAQKKTTRREKFLARMEAVIPWIQLLAVIEPFYPKGERGRPPVGLDPIIIDAEKRQMTLGISTAELKQAQESVEETRAPLPARRARQIRAHCHERLARRDDGCGFEVVSGKKLSY